jgi:hypothetical protein
MKYQYFIATRWRNRDVALPLIRMLRAKDKTVYTCFESPQSTERIKENPEVAMQKFEATNNWGQDEEINAIFQTDMQGLRESEALIMLLPAGKSSHIEAGAAYGMGKKCILIGEQKEAESLYLIFSEFYDSIDDFIKSIRKTSRSRIR